MVREPCRQPQGRHRFGDSFSRVPTLSVVQILRRRRSFEALSELVEQLAEAMPAGGAEVAEQPVSEWRAQVPAAIVAWLSARMSSYAQSAMATSSSSVMRVPQATLRRH